MPNKEKLRKLLQARDNAEQQYQDLVLRNPELLSPDDETLPEAPNDHTPRVNLAALPFAPPQKEIVSANNDQQPTTTPLAIENRSSNTDPEGHQSEGSPKADPLEHALARAGTVLIFIVCPCIACLYLVRRRKKKAKISFQPLGVPASVVRLELDTLSSVPGVAQRFPGGLSGYHEISDLGWAEESTTDIHPYTDLDTLDELLEQWTTIGKHQPHRIAPTEDTNKEHPELNGVGSHLSHLNF